MTAMCWLDLYLILLLVILLAVVVGLCAGYYMCMSNMTVFERYRRKIRHGFKN